MQKFQRNFVAFIWHALFLAFASIFIDVNTVLSSLILNIGGTSIHVGILTALSIGIPMIAQLFFAAFLSGRQSKKPFLLIGIYLRVFALAGMGYTLSIAYSVSLNELLLMIFLWITLFAASGAFAGISYTDLMGKIFIGSERERFLVFKQFVTATAMFAAAFLARYLVAALPYPRNYTLIFLIASGLLFLATFGFWMIREEASQAIGKTSIMATLKQIPHLLRTDKNLFNYIILTNLVSLGLTIIPFYMAYSKKLFGLNSNQTGNFLLLQFSGMILSTFIWKQVAKKFRFKGLAYGSVVFGSILPVIVLLLSRSGPHIFQWVFFIAGFFISAHTIFLQGMLLEISTNQNRAIYTGISGTLRLMAVIFPLSAGALIEIFDFETVILAVTPIVLSAIFFIRRVHCTRQPESINELNAVT